MSLSFDLGDVEVFTAGTVGRPGERVFFLQVRTARTSLTFRCEKQQVAALGDYMRELLGDLAPAGDPPDPSSLELVPPLEPEWTVGTIAVAFDPDTDRFVVLLEELVPEQDDASDEESGTEPSKAIARFMPTRAQAMAFCERAEALVRAGRPTCRFCGRPIDPDGHACPRMN